MGRVIQENYNADCTTHDLPCPQLYNSLEAYKCKFKKVKKRTSCRNEDLTQQTMQYLTGKPNN